MNDNKEISKELRFLLACSCKKIEKEQEEYIRETLKTGLDPEILKEEADRNRLYSIANYNLHRLGFDKDQQVAGIISAAKRYAFVSMILMKELVRVMKTFDENRIDSLLLKGPILAQMIYGNISLRPSRDLDICVKKEDFESAFYLLESLGYKNLEGLDTPKRKRYFFSHLHQHHVEMHNGEVMIELHWRAAEYLECSYEELIAENKRMTLAGVEVRVPDQIPYLYYLISHGAHHGYHRLRWLMDIYEILVSENAPDMLKVYAYFQEKRSEFLLIYTLLYMKRLGLSLNALSDMDQNIKNERVDKKEIEDAGKLLDESWILRTDKNVALEYQYEHFFEDMMEARGIRDYQSRLERLGIRTEIFKLISLPDSLFWFYYILRLFWWVWKKLPFSGEVNNTRSLKELIFRHE